jgi:hypothetical protein
MFATEALNSAECRRELYLEPILKTSTVRMPVLLWLIFAVGVALENPELAFERFIGRRFLRTASDWAGRQLKRMNERRDLKERVHLYRSFHPS